MAIPIPSDGSLNARRPTWGIPDAAIGWVGAYCFAIIGGALILAIAGYASDPDDAPLSVVLIANLPLWIGFAGFAIGIAAFKGNGWIRDFHVAIRAWDVPLGIAAGVAAQLIVVPLISLPLLKLTDQSADDLAKPAQDLADKAHGATNVVLFVVIVGLVAPVCEELFFRGLLFRALEKKWDRWWALGISSVVFAATHFQPLQFLPLAAAGAIFGYLVVRTDRLGPAIVAHMAFNLTTVVSLLWLT